MRSCPKNGSFSKTKVGTPQWPEAACAASLALIDRFVAIGIGRDGGIHRGEVEAGGRRGAREMVALVPSLGPCRPTAPG